MHVLKSKYNMWLNGIIFNSIIEKMSFLKKNMICRKVHSFWISLDGMYRRWMEDRKPHDCEAWILCLPNSVELGRNQATFVELALGFLQCFYVQFTIVLFAKREKKHKSVCVSNCYVLYRFQILSSFDTYKRHWYSN